MNPVSPQNLEQAISAIIEAKQEEALLLEHPKNTVQLESAINQVCTTFIDNWKQEHLPQIKSFRDASRDGIPTPALSVCGRGTQEIRWTKYLSYFLNPKAEHGLGSRLFKAAFGEFLRMKQIDLESVSGIQVEDEVEISTTQTESNKQNCRCDLVITDQKWVMFIEQKIKSGESNNLDNKKSQLRRYSEAIDINPAYRGKTIIKIFLTPTGRLPQKSKGWIPMTHQEIIHSGRKLLKDESLSPVARGNLTRFLLDMAVGPYNQTEELLTEMKKLAEGLCSDGFALHPYIRYSSLNQHHSRITELIREGSEWTK